MLRTAALVLSGSAPSSEASRIGRLLRFFGVESREQPLSHWLVDDGEASPAGVVCSSEVFAALVERCDRDDDIRRRWRGRVRSAFVYAGGDDRTLQDLIRRVTGDPAAVVLEATGDSQPWSVTRGFDELCGPMSGVSVAGIAGDRGAVFESAAVERIVSTGKMSAFFKIEYQGVPVFLCTASAIVDVDAPIAARNFDVRDHFLSTVPIVLYTRWAFADSCWQSPETKACLVIDDPLLTPTYGFLSFTRLLELMNTHDFSTSIAFIPWNWRRSRSKVVRLFEENPRRYSLSIHGCDHTGGEFGTRDGDVLAWKARQATERMSRHESRTGVRHDSVMVFPQGVFSDTAMGVLKRADFIAAVNTEVISADPEPPAIRTSDVWDVAVMNYQQFPIFTRRYPSQGVENFAFDILLGKPCLIVIHHDGCRDRCDRIAAFAKRLNALNCRLSWTNLGDVVRSACRFRERSPGVVDVEMYASELVVTNDARLRRRFVIEKRERDAAAVSQVLVDSRPVSWTHESGVVRFELDVDPAARATVRIQFHARGEGEARHLASLRYKVKTLVRRVGSEARDNYLAKLSVRFAG